MTIVILFTHVYIQAFLCFHLASLHSFFLFFFYFLSLANSASKVNDSQAFFFKGGLDREVIFLFYK